MVSVGEGEGKKPQDITQIALRATAILPLNLFS